MVLFRREVEKIGNDTTEDKTISRKEDTHKDSSSSTSSKTDSVYKQDTPRVELVQRVSINSTTLLFFVRNNFNNNKEISIVPFHSIVAHGAAQYNYNIKFLNLKLG